MIGMARSHEASVFFGEPRRLAHDGGDRDQHPADDQREVIVERERDEEKALARRIGERQGNSRLWDALVSGVSRLANEPGPRLLVMVSDGMATGNTATVDDVVRAANEAHVAISIVCEKWELRSGYGFAIRDRVDGPWFLLRSVTGTSIETYLGRLTSRTGGTLVVDGQGGPPALAEKLAAQPSG